MIKKILLIMSLLFMFGCRDANNVEDNITYKKLKMSFDVVEVVVDECCSVSTYLVSDTTNKLKMTLRCYEDSSDDFICTIPIVMK